MYEHILIPTDGSQLAGHGVDHGLALASKQKCKVTIVTATEPYGGQFAYASDLWSPTAELLAGYEQSQKEIADKILAEARAKAVALGVEAETVHVPGRSVSRAIIELAQELGCSLIVMASHGRTGVSRVVLGSQASAVAAGSKVPVLVVK